MMDRAEAITRLKELVEENADVGAQMSVLGRRRIDIDKSAAAIMDTHFPEFMAVTAGRDSTDKASKLVRIYDELRGGMR